MLHEEKQYPTVAPHIPPNSQMEMLSSLISEETDAVIEFSLVGRPFNASFLTIVADWDMDQVCTRCLFLSHSRAIHTQSHRVLLCATYQFCVSESNLVRSHNFVSNNLCFFVYFLSIGQLGRRPEPPPVPALSPWGRGRHRQAEPRRKGAH